MGKTTLTIKRNECIAGMFDAAKALRNDFSSKVKGNPTGRDYGSFHSSIILESLSIELSLKHILENSKGTYSKTHSVRVLFGELESVTKNKIEAAYNAIKETKPDWPILDDLISEVDSIFVDWRYATFDGRHLNIKVDSWNCLGDILKDELV